MVSDSDILFPIFVERTTTATTPNEVNRVAFVVTVDNVRNFRNHALFKIGTPTTIAIVEQRQSHTL